MAPRDLASAGGSVVLRGVQSDLDRTESRVTRILVVDDSPGDARLVAEHLREQAVELEMAVRLAPAMEIARRRSFDLVLLDLGLPDCHGIETFEQFNNALPHLPVVVLTDDANDAVALRAVQLGAQDYLVKDHLNAHTLERCIVHSIERMRALVSTEHLNKVLRAGRTLTHQLGRGRDRKELAAQACRLLLESGAYASVSLSLSSDRGAVAYEGTWQAEGGEVSFRSIPPPQLSAESPSDGCSTFPEASSRSDTFSLDQRAFLTGARARAASNQGQKERLESERVRSRMPICLNARLQYAEHDYGHLRVELPREVCFRAEEQNLLEELSADVAFAVHDVEIRAARHEAEQALAQRERELSVIYDNAPVLLLLVDSSRRVKKANKLAAEYGNFDQADGPMPLLGRALHCLNALSSPEGCGAGQNCRTCAIRSLVERTFGSGESYHQVETTYSAGDQGGATSVRLSVSTAKLGLDDEAHVLITLQDITERHRAERALRENESKFRSVFHGVTEGILLADAKTGRFFLANESMCEMLGYSAEELCDLNVSDVHPRGELSRVGECYSRCGKTHSRRAIEVRMRRKDGSSFFADLSSTEALISGRDCIIACYRDATEKRKLHATLAQSDRLSSMGMLAAGVAHEINNPLSYVLYNLESLADELPELLTSMRQYQALLEDQLDVSGLEGSDASGRGAIRLQFLDDVQSRFQDALHGTRRIRDIARGLGTFSKVEREQLVPVDLTRVFEAAVNMAYNEIKYRARLIKDYGRTPPVLASEGRVSQVLLNLLINAAHAIDEGNVEANEIRIRTWEEGGSVFAEIRDTGMGIADEAMSKLFEPFFTTKEVGVGSGLGLAISKNIIEGYDGCIDVTSRLGEGSTFLVRLPIRSPEAIASPTDVSLETPPPALRGRILVVDDEPGVRAGIRRILTGHEVVEAQSGEEARQILQRDDGFDFIVCDLMMPDLSGMELHEWLVDTKPVLAEEMIFISGGAFTPRARSYLRTTRNLLLEKPFDARNLVRIAQDKVLAARRRSA